mgnify:CR=1 FL=1
MDEPSFSETFTFRYRVALVWVAALATVCFTVQYTMMSPADGDSQRINQSGRQRMLSQRVALHTALLADPATRANDRDHHETLLAADLDEMAASIDTLAAVGAPRTLTPELRALYYGPSTQLLARTTAFLDLSRAGLADSQATGMTSQARRDAVADAAADLLPQLNRAVQLFELAAQDRIERIQSVLFLLYLMMVGTLTLVAVKVFAPAAAHLEDEELRYLSECMVREKLEVEDRFVDSLNEGMDLADSVADVIQLVERALDRLNEPRPAELLLADSSEAHLRQTAAHPTLGAPGCSVETPFQCPAVRKAQSVSFDSSNALDACPRLVEHATACSAYCVPVSFMGRALGVLHSTGPEGEPVPEWDRQRLDALCDALGSRLGSLRAFEQIQLQASTDPLTGLFNRRAFEEEVRKMKRHGGPFAVAMADLDHFKNLNDTYGHETGDRALSTFAKCLRDVVGDRGVVARFGGEEFVVALPSAQASDAAEVLDAVRTRLAAILSSSDLPSFTVSLGVCDSRQSADLVDMLALADAALYRAKKAGRDRICLADLEAATGERADDAEASVVLAS